MEGGEEGEHRAGRLKGKTNLELCILVGEQKSCTSTQLQTRQLLFPK